MREMNVRSIHRCLVAAIAALTACAGDMGAPLDAEGDTAGSEASVLSLGALAVRAIDADPVRAEDAIRQLRAAGPDGHRALLEAHADAIGVLRSGPTTLTPELERVRHAIDVVSGQRDGHASGLFWFTDLAAAQSEARRTGRPILALRLLGRLDEELSCANSRFFRVLLYADDAVRAQLASDFVLYWSSERPAPHITIDMGDGRTIERTITGNSIHYVMDADGRVLDGIPGLYTPADFSRRLTEARAIASDCAGQASDEFRACVARHHADALAATEAQWRARTMASRELPPWEALVAPRVSTGLPSAVEAMPITMGKSSVEMPMLDLMARPRTAQPLLLDWATLATTPLPLGASSRALLALKTGTSDVSELAARLSRSAAADTLLNETTTHRRVHEWLADPSSGVTDWATLNERVYTEIFLTPASDPWLGLHGNDVWDAIETAGR
jgi:hypothetical protein